MKRQTHFIYPRCLRALAVATLLASVAAPLPAGECIGVSLPDRMQAPDRQPLVLNGMGVRKATLFKVKVYVAGLYLPESSSDAQAIIDQDRARHLTLHFVRDVDAGDIREAWQEGFAANAGDRLDELGPRIKALQAMMADFAQGDRLDFDYRPGQGTQVSINGRSQGSIQGADFGSALIAIWLGEPPNPEIKSGLLGGECD
jgi:hypothetical protein